MSKQYIYIFDYCSRSICEIETTEKELDKYDSILDFLLEKYNIHEDYISIMTTNNKIDEIDHISK